MPTTSRGIKMYILLAVFLLFGFAKAELNIITTYPYIASITKEIVKDRAKVDFLADPAFDPHQIVPRPSLVRKLRGADLLIINGAYQEVGWLPPLIEEANNSKINIMSDGFLDLSKSVSLIYRPQVVSRAMGDVHPDGNPHYHLDPNNIPKLADAITERICKLDGKNCEFYTSNNRNFKSRWAEKLQLWNSKLSSLKGKKVIQFHLTYDYLINRYEMYLVGTLEPVPGIAPTARHLDGLIEKAKTQGVDFVFMDVYHPVKPAKYVAEKTGARLVVLPHDVGATPEAKDIFSMFDEIVKRLTE